MHKKLLEEATCEQLRDFACEMFDGMDEDERQDAEMRLYRAVHGPHFTEWLLEDALSKMDNEDGTKGGHWTLAQTDDVAKSMGIEFHRFNRYDWNYAMNMVRSDYYGAVPDSTEAYAKIAKRFLMDKDACDGKALIYYVSTSKL